MIQRDVEHYIAGVNRYIAEARLDPSKLPGEYAAIGRPQGPDPWKATDVIATASLVGGIFGKGGGAELEFARDPPGAARPPRPARGRPRVPRLPLGRGPRGARDGAPASASPTRCRSAVRARAAARCRTPARCATTTSSPRGRAARPPATRRWATCWRCRRPRPTPCWCPARASASGHPLMVAGPQTGYFNPQILIEQEVHAPGSEGRPPIDAGGAGFVGINLYVQLGRGRDYAWSATSAGQDNIDTFAAGAVRRHALPLSRRVRADRGADQDGRVDAVARRPDAGRLADAARGAHEARAGRRARDGPRQARDLHAPALDVLPRGRLGGRVPRLQHADGDHAARRRSSAPRAGSATRSTGSTRTPTGSRTSTRAPTPCAPPGSTTTCPSPAASPGAAGTRTALALGASRRPSSIRRRSTSATLVNWNNKQARGFASSDVNAYSPVYRSQLLVRPRPRGARRRPQAHAARPDRHHGGRRHERPARARGAAARAAPDRAAGGSAARRRRAALRAWRRAGGAAQGRRPRRRLRARRRDRADGRVVAALGARAVRARARARARWASSRPRCRSTTRRTTTASTSAPPTRARGSATCPRTCAPCSDAASAAATRASTAAAVAGRAAGGCCAGR